MKRADSKRLRRFSKSVATVFSKPTSAVQSDAKVDLPVLPGPTTSKKR